MPRKRPGFWGLLSLQSPVKLFRDQGSARELDAQGLLQSVLQQAQVLADLKKSILKVRWLLSQNLRASDAVLLC